MSVEKRVRNGKTSYLVRWRDAVNLRHRPETQSETSAKSIRSSRTSRQ